MTLLRDTGTVVAGPLLEAGCVPPGSVVVVRSKSPEEERVIRAAAWQAAKEAAKHPTHNDDPKPPPGRLGPNVFRTQCGAERRIEEDLPGYRRDFAIADGAVRTFERSGWTGQEWLWHEKGGRPALQLEEPAAQKLKKLETEHMKLRDQLGDKDHEIADLRAEVGRLTLEGRRAGR